MQKNDNLPTVSDGNDKELRFLLLNVRGITSKINLAIIQDYVTDFDVVGLTETLSNTFDSSVFPEFNVHFGENDKLAGFRGLAIMTRKSLDAKKITANDPQLGLWTHITHGQLSVNVGLFYVPPESSKSWTPDIFATIEDNILAHSGDNVIIMGDFNARTGTLSDFVDIEGELRNSCILPRQNADSFTNNNGRQFTELCKTSDLLILNGRFGSDGMEGKKTCTTHNGGSTIDYMCASQDIIKHIKDFHVHDFDQSLSDVHHPVSLSLSGNIPVKRSITDQPNKRQEKGTTLSWKDNSRHSYPANFDISALTEISDTIKLELEKPTGETTDACINEIYSRIRKTLLANATEIGAIKKRRQVKQSKQPWFDNSCALKKRDYHKSLRQAKRTNNAELRYTAFREYRNFVRSKKRNYTNTLNENLKTLKKRNAKCYWNIIKKHTQAKTTHEIPFDSLTTHFKHLNEVDPAESTVNDINPENEFINQPFSQDEVNRAIRKIKNGKACGPDDIYPEFIKYAPAEATEVFTDLFNLVLKTGNVPDAWATAIINPIHKKGSYSDPNNYRGISLISCLGKLFTALLNDRLSNYLESSGTIGNEQAGFRQGFSSNDHILVLHALISLYLNNGKKLHCAFIDYEKAFDTVNRSKLWQKVMSSDINGKIFNVVKNLYKKAKAQVRVGGSLSSSFKCSVGVRQGDNLSPLLFAIFVNDFETHLRQQCDGLSFAADQVRSTLSDDDVEVFLRLYTLLYADDTILLAETEADLERSIDTTIDYCSLWDLRINI